VGLRKELTAGCLIEKGATGTIYFGHRSLQEFLVAEHLIAREFGGALLDDKSAAIWTLALVSPEVGSFIVEAATSSPAVRATVLAWFDILKNLHRKDMPRSGMRFFSELYALFTDDLSDAEDPWFIWLRYFVANKAVEFAPKTGSAIERLAASSRFLAGSKEQQAAALMLFAEALAQQSDARTKLTSQFIAKWLDPGELRETINIARKTGNNKPHYVRMDDNLPLWCFLHATKIEGNPPRLIVDLKELRKRAGMALPMGFADEQDEIPEETGKLSVQIQAVYRAWNIRESELDKIRPFFAEKHLREKILPLEVVRMARQDSSTPSTASKVPQKPTFGLKKRSPIAGKT
jgi:hypothetical protein